VLRGCHVLLARELSRRGWFFVGRRGSRINILGEKAQESALALRATCDKNTIVKEAIQKHCAAQFINPGA